MFNDYTKKVVVFMDILGFKNIVKEINNEENVKRTLFDVMNYLKMLKEDNYVGFLAEYDLGKEVTVFSDSIVISYDVNFPGRVFHILIDIIHIQLDLAARGIILRGGVSIGELVHEKEIVFGPAMIRAYELENDIAFYPRIIVDKNLLEYAYMHPSPQHSREQEMEYIVGLLNEDKDGEYYTDFLAQWQELDHPSYIEIVKLSIREKIEKYIMSDNESLRKKYEWLKEYYNSIFTDKI